MILNESVLLSLAGRADIRRVLPELQALKVVDPGCARCVRKAQNEVRRVLRSLANLSEPRRDELKRALGVEKLAVEYRSGAQIKQVTW